MKNKSWVENSIIFEINQMHRKIKNVGDRRKHLPHMEKEFDYLLRMYSDMLSVIEEAAFGLELE